MELRDLPVWVTFLPSLIFETAVGFRNRLYDRGVLPRSDLGAPVISIGNLTVGGTGKTPLAVHVLEILLEAGFVPALLSRGYGRRGDGASIVAAPGEAVPAPASTLGDEPALIRRRVPGTWLGIDARRLRAGSTILARQPRAVFVLDDGFQHRRLSRSLDIVVVDASQPLIGNRSIPRGTLREPPHAVRRADAVMLNGTPQQNAECTVELSLSGIAPGLPLFRLTTAIESVVPFPLWAQGETRTAGPTVPTRVFLVAAIGNPARFRADVARLGFEVAGERFFRDHTRLRESDWCECSRLAKDSGAERMLTTEKDAIKLEEPPRFPLGVCVQGARVLESAAFVDLVRRTAGSRP